ncbi:hypothetical protein NIES4103_21670 [Nostoc sp. NIES-4103]|nr:hypothetical protein NIES4103_21670 [Nostoc sp. NIES-4103]
MSNNQIQSLSFIDGVEDICQENAATFSGGRIILYNGANQTGTSVSFTGGRIASLSRFGFDNRTSSIEITNNQTWQLWVNPNFEGNDVIYGKGKYNLKGLYNNNISSLSER